MNALTYIIYSALDLYLYIIIASVLMSWLVAFGVLNMRNHMAARVVHAIDAITEPAFALVRRILPPVGGLDLAPFGVIILIAVLQSLLVR